MTNRPEQPFNVPGNEFAILPSMLAPGDEWIGLINQDQVAELAGRENLYVGDVDTLSNDTTLVRLDTRKFREKNSGVKESTSGKKGIS